MARLTRARRLRRLLALCAALVLLGAVALTAYRTYRPNNPSSGEYPIRGADVSHYQGEIDFDRLAGQGLSFVYIKATEGSTHVDGRLRENLAAVSESPLRAGFYHFFSYDSPGETQAENFIANVPALEGQLPPAIDVEFYGDYFLAPAGRDGVVAELRTMVDALEAHYGVKPVLYCTQRAYRLYIRGAFDDCGLWIRSVYSEPNVDREWTFWQYTDRAKLEGYSGEEPYIDLNTFAGSAEAFAAYPHGE